MKRTANKQTKSEEVTQKHTFYLGNKGNHTVWQPWGQCTCGLSLHEPHLIVEHIEKHQANVNNQNVYTMLKYMVQEET